ncbi:MAG: riboflavin biosynthesis protein RibF [Hyphomonadaceae bacterium]|nr:riboflavin biosynthesis protein RibF [Hyphomonadaceae bacterium]
MRVIALPEAHAGDHGPVSLALGNFDGVHVGHQAVIADACAAARVHGATLAAAVFAPHPKAYFQPDAPPFRIQSDAQRRRALAACGVETLFEIRFDAGMARMDDADFVQTILVDGARAAHVSVGFDYHYGRARMGDAQTLRRHGEAYGFGVGIAAPILANGEKISSTGIRAALAAGDLAQAHAQLTRPFAIEGSVIDGFRRGRTIGVPTANVALGAYTRPRFGVYATRTDLGDGVLRAGVSNCGVKPTVAGDHAPLLETHLFDFDGDLYGRTIETQLLHFLRAERKFDSFEALRAQIVQDAAEARALLAGAQA